MPARSWIWIALTAAACIAYSWLVHALIVNADSVNVRTTLALVNGVPHAAINLTLLWMFGRTLARGREPLITGFARQVHGALPPELEAYTRNVTAAWCAFFAAEIAVSAVLLLVAPLSTWSLFVNTLTAPLVAAMFVGEYVLRRLRFPDHEHASIFKGVEMFIAAARARSAARRSGA